MMIGRLTFLYMYVCLCIILFNVAFNLHTKIQPRALYHKKKVLKDLLTHEIYRQDETKRQVLKTHLIKRLKNIDYLKAFHEALVDIEATKLSIDWILIGEVISDLSYFYRDKKAEKKAYFAYLVYFFDLNHKIETNTCSLKEARARLSRILMTFLWEDSIYARNNAFKAVMSLGIEEDALKALKIMDKRTGQHNGKLIQNHLLNFTGNHQKLADSLYDDLEAFTWSIQAAVINYLRMVPAEYVSHEAYWEGLYKLLCDENQHKEVRLALIRYFKKYYYLPVQETLIEYVQSKEEEKWEFAVVAAMALESYEGNEKDEALTEALSSSNWYIRLNAAESLINKGYSYEQLMQSGLDKYACDMLTYRRQLRDMKERRAI
ncbi:MAG: HEAT repeat domain-containing protein [Zhenhengia sp.]|uniref:HEAT repeat domain-containing protein n=1 Tax=Zhenhengia sp. TaxID=2944208 RepID=UPI003992E08B